MAQIQPSAGDVHVNRPLTNILVAHMQGEDKFVAGRMFPSVPVENKSDAYWEIPRGAFNRSEMRRRTPGTESAGIAWAVEPNTYLCERFALHYDIDDEIRANQDQPLSLDRTATMLLGHQAMLQREIDWADQFLKDSAWTFSADGAAAASATAAASLDFKADANNNLTYWNLAASTPIEDVRRMCDAIGEETGFRPNKLALSRPVWTAVVDHPDIVGRIDRGQTSGPAIALRDSVAALFELEEILVMDAIRNTAKEGQDASHSWIHGKNGLLAYVPPEPGLMVPSAGYHFNFTGYLGLTAEGYRMKKFRMEERNSDRAEVESFYQQKVISADLGLFLDDIVQ